jgi:hypothetical protein
MDSDEHNLRPKLQTSYLKDWRRYSKALANQRPNAPNHKRASHVKLVLVTGYKPRLHAMDIGI